MWGNKEGWIISAGIAVAMGLLLYFASTPGRPTPPTGTLKLAMQPAVLPVDPATVLPAPSKDCDAATTYRKAVDSYKEQAYEKYRQHVGDTAKAPPPELNLLVEASDCAKMHLFDAKPEEVVNYDGDRPALEALDKIGNLCTSVALAYAREGKVDEARKYATAGFNLGRHLYEERVVFAEWTLGISLMQSGAYVLQEIDTDAAKKEACKTFAIESNAYRREKILRLWEIVSGVGQADIAKYAGDIQLMARKENPERMWRVEALLKLGRYKFNSATRGDQSTAKHELTEIAATDPDPAAKAAAEAGRKMTIDEYRMLR